MFHKKCECYNCGSSNCLKYTTDETNQKKKYYIFQMCKGYNNKDAENHSQAEKEIIADLHELHYMCTACHSGSCALQENPYQYLSGWLWFQSIGAVLSTISESSTHDSQWVITNGKPRHRNSVFTLKSDQQSIVQLEVNMYFILSGNLKLPSWL